MRHCYDHPVCKQPYVQTSIDVDLVLRCMVARGVLSVTRKGKYRSNYAWAKKVDLTGQE